MSWTKVLRLFHKVTENKMKDHVGKYIGGGTYGAVYEWGRDGRYVIKFFKHYSEMNMKEVNISIYAGLKGFGPKIIYANPTMFRDKSTKDSRNMVGYMVMERLTCTLRDIKVNDMYDQRVEKMIRTTVTQMHDAGILHGDLSSNNVGAFIRNGVVRCIRIFDYGASIKIDPRTRRTLKDWYYRGLAAAWQMQEVRANIAFGYLNQHTTEFKNNEKVPWREAQLLRKPERGDAFYEEFVRAKKISYKKALNYSVKVKKIPDITDLNNVGLTFVNREGRLVPINPRKSPTKSPIKPRAKSPIKPRAKSPTRPRAKPRAKPRTKLIKNPLTGRYISKSSSTYKKLVLLGMVKNNRVVPAGMVKDPTTGKFIKVGGGLHRNLVKLGIIKSSG